MSGDNNYNWTRYWCLRGERYHFDNDGYLFDPATPDGQYYNSHLKKLSDLSEVPCLILLGESGVGKTTEIKLSRKMSDIASDNVLYVNLGDYNKYDELQSELFVNSRLVSWQNGTHNMYLYQNLLIISHSNKGKRLLRSSQ